MYEPKDMKVSQYYPETIIFVSLAILYPHSISLSPFVWNKNLKCPWHQLIVGCSLFLYRELFCGNFGLGAFCVFRNNFQLAIPKLGNCEKNNPCVFRLWQKMLMKVDLSAYAIEESDTKDSDSDEWKRICFFSLLSRTACIKHKHSDYEQRL